MEREPEEPQFYSEEEYLEISSRSGEKYEYCNGLMWRREDGPPGQDVEAPGTQAACSALAFNLAALVGAQIVGSQFHGHAGAVVLLKSDSFKDGSARLESRSDVAIVRGEALAASVGGPLEPVAILQIERPGTRSEEFGARWPGYTDTPGLLDVVRISCEFRSVRHHARQSPTSWLIHSHEQASPGEPDIQFSLLGAPISLSMDAIYQNVSLSPSPYSLSPLAPPRFPKSD